MFAKGQHQGDFILLILEGLSDLSTVVKNGKPDYGSIMRYCRKRLNVKAEQLAAWYGKAIGESVTARRILQMEQMNDVPEDIKRRLALARLLHIPLALFGLSALEEGIVPHEQISALTKIPHISKATTDLGEARTRLRSYWKQNHTGTAIDVLGEIWNWIGVLEDAIFYGGTTQKEINMWYLCGYHMVFANIVRDLGSYDLSITHLNKAYHLAGNMQDATKMQELKALVFHRRGVTLQEKGEITAALHDFQAAQSLLRFVSPQLRGAVLSSLGHAAAHQAQDLPAHHQAIRWIDEGARWIEPGKGEDEHFVRFGEERHHLDKAAAYLTSPIEKLRFPRLARRELRDALTSPHLKRRYAYNAILQAKSYVVEKEYPQAIERAAEALTIIEDIKSGVNLARIINIYEEIKESKYGNHDDVMRLGIHLLKVEFPTFYH